MEDPSRDATTREALQTETNRPAGTGNPKPAGAIKTQPQACDVVSQPHDRIAETSRTAAGVGVSYNFTNVFALADPTLGQSQGIVTVQALIDSDLAWTLDGGRWAPLAHGLIEAGLCHSKLTTRH